MLTKKMVFAAAALGVLVAAQAAAPKNAGERAQFDSAIQSLGVKPEDVREAPVAGLMEVSVNGMTGYMTSDGRYFIRGDIFEVATRVNVTQQRRQEQARMALAALDEKDMIVFAPAQPPKYTVTVFTDVDCGYCRKLHSEIAKYNEMGIEVRYIAYPRSGPNTESWTAMESVWCASNPKDALTRAKLGEKIEAHCDHKPPIESQYQLGGKLGIGGTPAMFAEDGRQLGGYVPPQQLLGMLEPKTEKVAQKHD